VSPLLLDTHVLYWFATDPDQLSDAANQAISEADQVAVASVTWYELSWLAHHGRIAADIPVRGWLSRLARDVVTFQLTPAIADTAVCLPETFPRDPSDRVIYATAIENGLRLVSKDRRLRGHPYPRPLVVW